jgi:hypothetical protein
MQVTSPEQRPGLDLDSMNFEDENQGNDVNNNFFLDAL